MKWDMEVFNFKTHEMAVSNFIEFLSTVARRIESANTDAGTFEQLRGVKGVCIKLRTPSTYKASPLTTFRFS